MHEILQMKKLFSQDIDIEDESPRKHNYSPNGINERKSNKFLRLKGVNKGKIFENGAIYIGDLNK